jgi:hypothetical protein
VECCSLVRPFSVMSSLSHSRPFKETKLHHQRRRRWPLNTHISGEEIPDSSRSFSCAHEVFQCQCPMPHMCHTFPKKLFCAAAFACVSTEKLLFSRLIAPQLLRQGWNGGRESECERDRSTLITPRLIRKVSVCGFSLDALNLDYT